MKNNGFKLDIDNLTPKEKEYIGKEFRKRLLVHQKIFDLNRDYLESLPTKELRISELTRLKNEYYERRK